MRIPFLIIFLALIALPQASLAQDAEPAAQTAAQKRAAAKRASEQIEKRIENDMTSMTNLTEALSKNMGQMHFMRTLCFGNADQRWRDYAARMMSLEAGNDPSVARELTRAFNAGYYEQQGRYSACDNTAGIEAAALAENGRRLSNMLADPYRER